jgi:hypothetical protein
MVASLCRTGCGAPLFLHVLGAFVLVGGIAALSTLSIAAWWRPERAFLARSALGVLLLVVWPGWVVMRAAGQWLDSKEDIPGDPTWLGIGFAVGDLGLLVLLVLTVSAFLSVGRAPRAGRVVAVLAPLYLAALAVAWWVMAAKPD